MYKAITITFLCLCSIISNAQEDDNLYLEIHHPYKVYLNDNSVLRGDLLREEEDFIELGLLDGSTVKILTQNIADIVKFKTPFPKIYDYNHHNDFPNGTSYRITGSYIIMQIGLIPDNIENIDKDPTLKPTFTLINGYKFKQGFAIGLGVNFDVYHKHFFPVFIDFRKYFTRRPVSLFVSGDIGYGFAFSQFAGNNNEIQKGGTMLQGGGGLTIATKKNMNVLLEVGFRSQAHKKKESFPPSFGISIFEHWIFQIGLIF